MNTPQHRQRTWGFRFSGMDAAMIAVFVAGAVLLKRWESPMWWMLVIVAGHFFLFCNVFRIVRRRELAWAGLLVLNVVAWALAENLNWLGVLLCQLPASVWVIVADMRSPNYHGVFANRLNPHLEDYLSGATVATSGSRLH